MKYALIGCGRISTNHMKAAVNNHLEIAKQLNLKRKLINLFSTA